MSEQHELMEVDEPSPQGNGLNRRKLTRGEKSKIAAKTRRDKENIAYSNLVSELPIANNVLSHMDKASVIKLAIFYIKLKHFLQKDILTSHYRDIPKEARSQLHSLKSPSCDDAEDIAKELKDVEGQMMLDALNGFLIFITRKFSIRFISASVTDHLGLNVENLIGKCVNDIIHPCDLAELTKQFMPEGSHDSGDHKLQAITDKSCTVSAEDKSQKVFYLRMKYNMCKPGSKTKQTGFTLVQWSGKLKQHISKKTGSIVTDGLVCICRPMQTSSVMEIRMDGNMFMSRHDLGMTFTFCDSRILTLIGYEPDELVGKTAYHFHNPIDAPKVSDCHQNLIIKGTSVSKYYRFLGKNDNWVWLQTRATIIYNTANKPQYIVCMNYVISEEEGERYLMLEEHKHANTHNDNAVVTLPDNHHPTYVFQMEGKCPTAGPTIVELEEGNLEKTACLNGELDRPKSSSSSLALSVNRAGTPQEMSASFRQMVECDRQRMAGVFPWRTNVLPSVEQASPVIKQLPLQPSKGSLLPLDSKGSLPLQECVAQPVESKEGREPFPDNNDGNLFNGFPALTNMLTEEEAQLNPLAKDIISMENGLNKFFTSSSGRPYPNSEDGGYESAPSPASSNRSPQVVSPYTTSDIEQERAYMETVPENGQTMSTDSNPAIINNCNFGVGYPVRKPCFDDYNKSSDIPEAENILDELLQSLNESMTGNIEENAALMYSTIQSLANQSSQTETNAIDDPDCVTTDTPVSSDNETIKDHSKTDKSVLRHILTIPEDRIPKKPVSCVQPSSTEFNTDAVKSPRPCAEKKPCFVKTNKCSRPPTREIPSGKTLIDLMIQKSLVQKPAVGNSAGQGILTSDQSVTSNAQLPDDISDFALQYMETNTGDTSEYEDLEDLTNDIIMNTADNSPTQGILAGLQHQCNTGRFNGQVKVKVMNRNGQSQYNCEQRRKCNTGSQSSTQQSLNYSSAGHGPPLTSSQDHGYVQKDHLSNGKLCNNSFSSNKTVSYKESQTQTCSPPISELEKHLRNSVEYVSHKEVNVKAPCGEASLLQKLLTGELSKDSYMQMELNRYPRGHRLKPN